MNYSTNLLQTQLFTIDVASYMSMTSSQENTSIILNSYVVREQDSRNDGLLFKPAMRNV